MGWTEEHVMIEEKEKKEEEEERSSKRKGGRLFTKIKYTPMYI